MSYPGYNGDPCDTGEPYRDPDDDYVIPMGRKLKLMEIAKNMSIHLSEETEDDQERRFVINLIANLTVD